MGLRSGERRCEVREARRGDLINGLDLRHFESEECCVRKKRSGELRREGREGQSQEE